MIFVDIEADLLAVTGLVDLLRADSRRVTWKGGVSGDEQARFYRAAHRTERSLTELEAAVGDLTAHARQWLADRRAEFAKNQEDAAVRGDR
jgi:hypothetical protein